MKQLKDKDGKIVAEIPDNLKVGECLYLSNTKITKLPDNLKVGGSLDLSNTKITKLRDNLKVGGYLDLSNTKIKREDVPKHLINKCIWQND